MDKLLSTHEPTQCATHAEESFPSKLPSGAPSLEGWTRVTALTQVSTPNQMHCPLWQMPAPAPHPLIPPFQHTPLPQCTLPLPHTSPFTFAPNLIACAQAPLQAFPGPLHILQTPPQHIQILQLYGICMHLEILTCPNARDYNLGAAPIALMPLLGVLALAPTKNYLVFF